ncbi:MAG: hypothetical protein HC820_03130 [Hydrococcus sp. RM1_1_31]|nr:hypothetical protein [Hydrococcus sp. RM1_1_31]
MVAYILSKEKYSTAYQNYLRSHRWRKKSAWVRSLTRPWWLPRSAPGRCCLFPWLPNRETHHLTYFLIFSLGWNWFGFEQPFWHLVPLSKTAHDLVGKSFYGSSLYVFWLTPIFACPF